MNRELFEQMVNALNTVHGQHEGRRPVHVRGACARGTFTATAQASELTRAPHMQGTPIPVTVRFSNGSGDPAAPDRRKDARGMAVKFHLDGGRETDMVAISLPVFFVRTPEDFLDLQAAIAPDPATGKPDPERSMAFVQAHPEALPALTFVLGLEPQTSYAGIAYRGLHAFRFVDAAGQACFVRYRWEPEAGSLTLSHEDAKALPVHYLGDELTARLAVAPVAFRLHVQIAEGGDPTDDPTVDWPSARRDVEIGTLRIEESLEDCDEMLFDPMMLVDGIEASEDQILRARSGAYGVSYKRRRAAATT